MNETHRLPLFAILAELKSIDPVTWQRKMDALNNTSVSPITVMLMRLQNTHYLKDTTVYDAILREANRASFSSGSFFAINDWCLKYRPNLDQMISVVERAMANHG